MCKENDYQTYYMLAGGGHIHEDDAVLMNPPFSDECRHIRYAYDFLKPGGRLATVCCVRMMESDNRKYADYRDWLSGQRFRFVDTEERFEATGTNTKILVIEKPAA